MQYRIFLAPSWPWATREANGERAAPASRLRVSVRRVIDMTSINITIQFARDVTDACGIQSLGKGISTMKTAYQIDPAHSGVHFSVRHLMLSNVRGTFSGVTGTVLYDPADPASTEVDATVDAATLSTGDPK